MWKLKKKHTYLSFVNLILHNYFMDHVCITHNGYLLGFVSSYYISLIGVENLGMLINFINYIWRYFNSFRATIAIVKRSCTLGFVLSKELWVLQSRSSLWSITEAATHYHIMITHYCLDETKHRPMYMCHGLCARLPAWKIWSHSKTVTYKLSITTLTLMAKQSPDKYKTCSGAWPHRFTY